MPNYVTVRKYANRSLSSAGQVVTISYLSQGEYDPATSTTEITETIETGIGVSTRFKSREIDGVMIQRGDILFLLSALNTQEPSINDKIMINSDVYTVKNVESVKPASIAVLYKCQLRK